MDLLLSMFPKRDVVFFNVKNGKGLTKVIKIGATVTESKYLTITANPFVRTNKFALRESSSGGIVLEQSYDGDIQLDISEDAKLAAVAEEPTGNYIKVAFRKKLAGKWKNCEAYVKI